MNSPNQKWFHLYTIKTKVDFTHMFFNYLYEITIKSNFYNVKLIIVLKNIKEVFYDFKNIKVS